MHRALAIASILALAACSRDPASPIVAVATKTIDYNRDVRPILADRCFRCHGPDSAARKRGLRLDTPEGAMALLASGKHALVAGSVNESELARRIQSSDDDD